MQNWGMEKSLFRLRIDQPLKNWLAQEARLNRRSLNAEILARLEASKDGPRHATAAELEAYDVSEGERALIEKLRRLDERAAGTAVDVIDALAATRAL